MFKNVSFLSILIKNVLVVKTYITIVIWACSVPLQMQIGQCADDNSKAPLYISQAVLTKWDSDCTEIQSLNH